MYVQERTSGSVQFYTTAIITEQFSNPMCRYRRLHEWLLSCTKRKTFLQNVVTPSQSYNRTCSLLPGDATRWTFSKHLNLLNFAAVINTSQFKFFRQPRRDFILQKYHTLSEAIITKIIWAFCRSDRGGGSVPLIEVIVTKIIWAFCWPGPGKVPPDRGLPLIEVIIIKITSALPAEVFP